VLNLQLFHRADAATHPQLPVLAELLEWPRCTAPSVVCDNATRVSKKGAITWWHIDDCGELVLQTGLNLPKTPSEATTTADDESARLPVKLFIYGPPSSYDWFSHDAQSDRCGRIAALDILHAPCDALPPADLLPVVTVAILRAGGRPLLSPPNIPHLVVTVRDCVMVEQRRVALHFMHEVAYFAQRMQLWRATPVVYPVLRDDLQDTQKTLAIVDRIAARLRDARGSVDDATLRRVAAAPGATFLPLLLKQPGVPPASQAVVEELRAALVVTLCVRSLLSLLNPTLFNGSAGADEAQGPVHDAVGHAIMAYAVPPELVDDQHRRLAQYCDVERAAWAQTDADACALFAVPRLAQSASWTGTVWSEPRAASSDGVPESAAAATNAAGFCAVLFYGGDGAAAAAAAADPSVASASADETAPAGAAAASGEAAAPALSAGERRLRNGYMPCWGPLHATLADARAKSQASVQRLVAAGDRLAAALSLDSGAGGGGGRNGARGGAAGAVLPPLELREVLEALAPLPSDDLLDELF
jgi:hypothetical protein